MHGIAAHFAKAADSRLARAHGADRLAVPLGTAQFYDRAETFHRARDKIERGFVSGDELAAFVIVGIRQQGLDRDVGEFWVAVEFFAVGESEFGAFDLQMNEFGAARVEPVELKSLQQRELLQHHRTLAPDAGLADGVAAIIIGQRRLDGRLPARHVVGRKHAAMRRTRDVHDLLRAAEFVDRFRHKALRPGFSRTLDLRDTVPARALGFLEDAGVGFREFFVGEQRAGPRHFIVRQIDRGRCRPVLAEQLLNDLDGRRRTLDQRIAVAGVGDRRLQHIAQPHRAVVPKQ